MGSSENKGNKRTAFRCLIDGYNLMFESVATPDLKLGSSALRQARERLLEFVACRMSESERKATWIVFDSRHELGLPEEMVYREMQITFAIHESSADEFMRKWIRNHGRPSELTVVSSDHQIQRTAKARGAHFFDCEYWVCRVLPENPIETIHKEDHAKADHGSYQQKPLPRDVQLPEEETRNWLKTFGFDDL